MEPIQWFFDILGNLDIHMAGLFQEYGLAVYIVLFILVFCETGLVVAPFLPGDSLLFTAGAVAALGHAGIAGLFFLFLGAAVLGNVANYTIGRFVGKKICEGKWQIFIKRENINAATGFFERYGGMFLVFSRFMPVIRTIAPFSTGMAGMCFGEFFLYNFIGSLFWVLVFLFAGYFFGQQPLVKEHLSLVIVGILLVSFLPVVIARLYSAYCARKK